MKKVLIWLSWGVDSAVSAYLLKKQGYDVTAWFMINYLAPEWEYCPTLDDIEEAKKVAKFLDIPFFTFDYREEYEKRVLDYMYEWYKKWITPNPDVMCNKEIKFKMFLEEAMNLGFDYIATGHYARIEEKYKLNWMNADTFFVDSEIINNNKFIEFKKVDWKRLITKMWNSIINYHLLKWVDANKDQSYFLAFLDQYQLSKSLFPIGDLEKSEVRKIAENIWLPNAKRKDSQWICFVWKVNLSEFLEKKIEPREWYIIDTKWKILGKHKWVFYYTIWQRKWIDIGWLKEPIFVIKKDIVKNELIVWTENDLALYSKKLYCNNLHFIAEEYEFPIKAKAKIRYRQEDQKVKVYKIWENRYEFEFKEEQRAIASGQVVALYNWNELIASGIIE